ncbi:hypothetical protein [Amaricoccus sp.]|uniref:hypothetical protein n=1 Tax=Amaricoccus sp. TaxID=1872485 RepID=UPI001B5167AE|nr:hypothetical protein [Amaricoccus sp.]MBP7003000.1 hypothetical protein [Amaricoccus sp.]
MQLFLGTGLASARHMPGGPPDGTPRATRPPALVGAGRVGERLGVDPGVWSGARGLGFAWLRNGVPVAGAVRPAYEPAAADDRAAIACRVTAAGPGGVTALVTPPITIAFPAPTVVGPVPDLIYTQLPGSNVVDISPFFTGSSLQFSVTGAGVVIDPATGVVTLDVAALAAGGVVTVAAANSGGRVEFDLALRLAAAPAVVASPTLSGSGAVGATLGVDPGVWSGQPAPAFAFEWLADGVVLPGETGPGFVPGPAEDGKSIACRVTATNVAGAAAAETAAIPVRRDAPAAVGALADLALARGAGVHVLDAAAAFSGGGLVFAVEGAGAGIDAATGRLSIPTDAALAAAPVVVTATNSGGAAQASFAVTVLAAPSALAAPAPVALAVAAGTGAVEAAAFFAGDALVYALDAAPAGVTIDAATGRIAVPTAAALAGEVVVRASNAVGAATQRVSVEVRDAAGRPTAVGTPAAAVFLQGTGVQTVSAQAYFAGEGLAYALDAAPAGVTINPGSGLVSVPTEAAFAAAPVKVRASNAAGAATQTATVTVRATRTVFDAAAALADVKFLFPTAAPAWKFNAGGFARLTSGANDRAHGDWGLALGDGRYRALARWNAGVAAPAQSRPFGLIGRMSKTGANFLGVRVDAVLQTNGTQVLQIRDYIGKTTNSTTVRQTAVAWAWDAWSWFEVEFEGATVRARVYPEAAAAPAWQITATTTTLAPGAFGPTTHVAVNGQTPVVDIRRLEFLPLAPAAPVAAAEGDWALGQITVKS